MNSNAQSGQLQRRAFLRGTTLVLTCVSATKSIAVEDAGVQQFALVTDLHYADKASKGSRYYRQSIEKLGRAADEFREASPSFLVELGDFIDAADSVETELRYLKRINREFSQICPQRHYVLGNHCVDTLRKSEFLDEVEQGRSFYSFDAGGTHFIVLDSCFRSDGTPYQRKNFEWTDANIPDDEIDWLRADLAKHSSPTIVFAHQRLDLDNHYAVRNAAKVRRELERNGQVQVVFQGHSHKNDHREIAGIHYCTLVAMVEGTGTENNGFSLVTRSAQGTISVEGFAKQANYTWPDNRRQR